MTDDVEIVRALLKSLYEQQCSHNNLAVSFDAVAPASASNPLELPAANPERRKPPAQCGI